MGVNAEKTHKTGWKSKLKARIYLCVNEKYIMSSLVLNRKIKDEKAAIHITDSITKAFHKPFVIVRTIVSI